MNYAAFLHHFQKVFTRNKTGGVAFLQLQRHKALGRPCPTGERWGETPHPDMLIWKLWGMTPETQDITWKFNFSAVIGLVSHLQGCLGQERGGTPLYFKMVQMGCGKVEQGIKKQLQTWWKIRGQRALLHGKRNQRKSALPSINSGAHVKFLDWASLFRIYSKPLCRNKEFCLEVQPGALNLLDEKSPSTLSTPNSQLIPHKSQDKQQQRQSCPSVV